MSSENDKHVGRKQYLHSMKKKWIVKFHRMRIHNIVIVRTLKSCTPIRLDLTVFSAYELKL